MAAPGLVPLAAGTVDGVTYTVPLALFDLVPVILTVGNDQAEILLLTAMVIGSLGVTVHLIRRAARARDRTAALLLGSILVVTFVLAGLARVEQTAATQWVEEGSNALAQLLLLVAVARLVRSTGTPGDLVHESAPLTTTGLAR